MKNVLFMDVYRNRLFLVTFLQYFSLNVILCMGTDHKFTPLRSWHPYRPSLKPVNLNLKFLPRHNFRFTFIKIEKLVLKKLVDMQIRKKNKWNRKAYSTNFVYYWKKEESWYWKNHLNYSIELKFMYKWCRLVIK